jgi:tRNA dimethylallyltransferase
MDETLAPLVVIAGPTASGKTAQAIRVAQRLGAEIVSADSQQVYRGFDIGTAKPTAAERACVPHHLVDVADPRQTFSAARFGQLADAAIAQIRARGKRVVVAGGTGLYLRVLLHGVVPAPPADPALREALVKEAEAQGRLALWERLRQVDPETAAVVFPQDLVRIIRALEIHTLTGTAASSLRRAHGFAQARHPFSLWVLDPPQQALYATIEARARQMFEGGLVDEVRSHLAAGLGAAAPMKGVGYVQARAHLEGALGLQQAIEQTARQTRRYAKRQLTWFRKEAGAVFIRPPYSELDLLS